MLLLMLVVCGQPKLWFERQGWPDVVVPHRRFVEHEHGRSLPGRAQIQAAADALARTPS